MENHWLQFLHKSVMADENNECLLINREGNLAVRITHRFEGRERISHEFLYQQDAQRDPESMLRGVMAQAKKLNLAVAQHRTTQQEG